ncbi:MAG: hypothetical protein V7736_18505 [Colwellia polaris]|uniref:hypothetical protein n=1 Tax=Colwellia polaris TaxID=326537 RepID=UPI000A16D0D7|nr:hypothetical protein [Colwellia polaris]
MLKFDKFALYLMIPLVIILFIVGMGHDFRPNRNPFLSLLGIVSAAIISIYCFRYQFFVWLPKNKIKRYSIKWTINVFITLSVIPLLALFFGNIAFSSGVGKILTSLTGTQLEPTIVGAEVVYVTNSRTWCHKYLESEALGGGTIGIKFCIDDDVYNHISNSVELKLISKQSNYGYLVEEWSVIGL